MSNTEDLQESKIQKTILSWIKVLLPVALGAFGWYISQIIAPIDSRMTTLEENQKAIITQITRLESDADHDKDKTDGLIGTVKSQALDHVRRAEYNKDINRLDAGLNELRRHNNNNYGDNE